MAEKSGKDRYKNWIFSERPWRRLALAVPISIILHLVAAVVMRPDYKPVSDHAVDMDIIDMKPGPSLPEPPLKPQTQTETSEIVKTQPAPAPEKRPEPQPAPAAKPVKTAQPTVIAMHRPGHDIADAGVSDSGAQPMDQMGVLAGAEQLDGGLPGAGICMHDLFPFSEPDPSWVLWISLKSFRETALQSEIGDTLASYSLGAGISAATGIDPGRDAEGVIVTASDIFDPKTYSVAVSYDSGESKIRRNLGNPKSENPDSGWQESGQGNAMLLKNGFRWHLAGKGRVLVVKNALPGKTGSLDAGVAPELSAISPDTIQKWPDQVACLSLDPKTRENPAGQAIDANSGTLLSRTSSFWRPDSNGHWPVALFATRDPRAVGLGPANKNKSLRFLFARARFYFSDPVRVQGEVYFSGPEDKIAALGERWRKLAAATSGDPFFAMAGLGRLFDKLSFAASKNKIEFSLELTESQVRAGLVFLQLQGSVLERHLKE